MVKEREGFSKTPHSLPNHLHWWTKSGNLLWKLRSMAHGTVPLISAALIP